MVGSMSLSPVCGVWCVPLLHCIDTGHLSSGQPSSSLSRVSCCCPPALIVGYGEAPIVGDRERAYYRVANEAEAPTPSPYSGVPMLLGLLLGPLAFLPTAFGVCFLSHSDIKTEVTSRIVSLLIYNTVGNNRLYRRRRSRPVHQRSNEDTSRP